MRHFKPAGTTKKPGPNNQNLREEKMTRAKLTVIAVLGLAMLMAAPALAANGDNIWTMATGGAISGSAPALDADGKIFIGSTDSKLYALNTATVTKLWEFATLGAINTTPAVGDSGLVYVASDDNRLYAIDRQTGQQAWAYDIEGKATTNPALAQDGVIIIGSDTGKIFAINPDGTLKWEKNLGVSCRSSIIIGADHTIYLGLDDGYFMAMKPDGTQKWETLTTYGRPIRSAAAVSEEGIIFFGAGDGNVYALDSQDGEAVWSYPTGQPVTAGAVLDEDGQVYVGSLSGYLFAFDSAYAPPEEAREDTTPLLWRYDAARPIGGAAVLGQDGLIYFATLESAEQAMDAKLIVVDNTGALAWEKTVGPAMNPAPLLDDRGLLYAGADDGALRAFETAAQGLAASQWPTFLQNAARTGRAPDNIPPDVQATTPEDLAQDVPVDAIITVTFTEEIDPQTVTSDSFQVGHGQSLIAGTLDVGPDTVTFTPSGKLLYATVYNVKITTAVTDKAGNPFSLDYIFSFETAVEDFENLCFIGGLLKR